MLGQKEWTKEEMLKLIGGDGDNKNVEVGAIIRAQNQNTKGIEYLIDTSPRDTIIDLMMRTKFDNHQELIYTIAWIKYVRRWKLDEKNVILYLAGKPAIGGQSRQDVIDVMNTFKWMETKRQPAKDGKDGRRRLPFG